MKRIVSAAVIVVLSFAICVEPARSQSQAASISGVVSDSSGSLIPGVMVTATNTDSKSIVKTVTNEIGKYSLPSLQPGTYDVRASLTGFVSTGVQKPLTSGESAQLNFRLQIVSPPDHGGPSVIPPGRNQIYR